MKLTRASRWNASWNRFHHPAPQRPKLMTELETPQPDREQESAVATATDSTPEAEPEPPPEPWTPERVSEWNAYYDVYVMAAALLLVFVVSCNYVAGPRIFSDLKA